MARKPRNWRRAIDEKAPHEFGCRVCGIRPYEWAHVLGRKHDDRSTGIVDPNDIVPLCGPYPEGHHGDYDLRGLDLTKYLRQAEIDRAVELVGPGLAARRIRNERDPAALPGH